MSQTQTHDTSPRVCLNPVISGWTPSLGPASTSHLAHERRPQSSTDSIRKDIIREQFNKIHKLPKKRRRSRNRSVITMSKPQPTHRSQKQHSDGEENGLKFH